MTIFYRDCTVVLHHIKSAQKLTWKNSASSSSCLDMSAAFTGLHHHHHHQSLNREGRWGTTDDFATSYLHFSLFSTALWDLANSRPVHSLMLSDERETWPYHCSLRLFTMVRRLQCSVLNHEAKISVDNSPVHPCLLQGWATPLWETLGPVQPATVHSSTTIWRWYEATERQTKKSVGWG